MLQSAHQLLRVIAKYGNEGQELDMDNMIRPPGS